MKKIALIAPSSPVPALTPETIRIISDRFQSIGYQLHLGSHVLDSLGYLAGSDEDRAKDVMTAFTDKSVDVVMTVRGGYGSERILDMLDYDLIRKNAKPFWTLSDGTALQNALFTKAGVSGYSGLIALFLLNSNDEALVQKGFEILNGGPCSVPIKESWVSGRVSGQTVGGNLTVFTSLVGTPYFPDTTGKILVLEDINEAPYRVDRMLCQLRLAGALDKVAGVILGDFSQCVAQGPTAGTVDAVLKDYFGNGRVPVARINYGHCQREEVVPIGRKVILDTAAGNIREDV